MLMKLRQISFITAGLYLAPICQRYDEWAPQRLQFFLCVHWETGVTLYSIWIKNIQDTQYIQIFFADEDIY